MLTNIMRLILSRSTKPFVFKNENNYQLDLDVQDLGVYIHIPFCKTICPFCPYNKVQYDLNLANRYKDALIKEIQIVSTVTKQKKKVSSIYLGGGTPALLSEHLKEIIDVVKNNYELLGNTGIELHPQDINNYLIDTLKLAEIDMVSVGVQSFQKRLLTVLKRDIIGIERKLGILRSGNFKVIDIDLIFGIPGQTIIDLKEDFKTAVDLGATQISTYPFIDFSYTENENRPLRRNEKREMLLSLLEVSKELGFERTSVWTFAKKYSPKYSSVTRDNFIGFGASATTLLKDIFKINTFSISEYINCVTDNRIPTALTLRFTERTRALYWLFWSSYNMSIQNNSFQKLFNKKVEDLFGYELAIAKVMKYIESHDGGYRLTEKGAYVFHLIEQEYTHQYIDKTWRIAGKEAFPKEIILY